MSDNCGSRECPKAVYPASFGEIEMFGARPWPPIRGAKPWGRETTIEEGDYVEMFISDGFGGHVGDGIPRRVAKVHEDGMAREFEVAAPTLIVHMGRDLQWVLSRIPPGETWTECRTPGSVTRPEAHLVIDGYCQCGELDAPLVRERLLVYGMDP